MDVFNILYFQDSPPSDAQSYSSSHNFRSSIRPFIPSFVLKSTDFFYRDSAFWVYCSNHLSGEYSLVFSLSDRLNFFLHFFRTQMIELKTRHNSHATGSSKSNYEKISWPPIDGNSFYDLCATQTSLSKLFICPSSTTIDFSNIQSFLVPFA